MFNIQKRCVRILFGDNYSFDHPEYYLTFARDRTYMDHTTFKDYRGNLKNLEKNFMSKNIVSHYSMIITY